MARRRAVSGASRQRQQRQTRVHGTGGGGGLRRGSAVDGDSGDDAAGSVLLAATVAVVSGAVYFRTAFRTIGGGDATELAFAACQLGAVHPPGYPLFTMIAGMGVSAVRWLGAGSPAFGANLASAACAAAANGALCLAADAAAGGSALAGIAAAAAFGLAPLVWQYAILSEVFALNNALMAAALYVLVRFEGAVAIGHHHAARRRGQAGALLVGLALSNQHTALFYAAPVVAWVVLCRYRRVWVGHVADLAGAAGLGVLGLLPYAYLPWASARRLPGNWGELTTAEGLWRHLTRAEYGSLRLYSGAGAEEVDVVAGLSHYTAGAVHALSPPGVLLLLCGVAAACSGAVPAGGDGGGVSRSGVTALRVALGCFVLYTVGFHCLANLPIQQPLHFGVLQRFWMQSHVVLALSAGVGARAALGWATSYAKREDSEPQRRFPALVAMGLALSSAAYRCVSLWPSMDESSNDAMVEYARDVLTPLPSGARVIVKGDLITNGMRYLQVCEGYRADVQMVDQAMLTYPWFLRTQKGNLDRWVWPNEYYHPYEPKGFSMKELIDANYAAQLSRGGRDGQSVLDDPIFIAGGWNEQDPSTNDAYSLVLWGMVEMAIPAQQGFMASAEYGRWALEAPQYMPSLEDAAAGLRRWDTTRWERVCAEDRFTIWQKLGYSHLMYALANDPARQPEAALAALDAYMALDAAHPSLPPEYVRNLAIAANAVTHAAIDAGACDGERYAGAMRTLWAAAGRWLRAAPLDTLEASDARERRAFEQMRARAVSDLVAMGKPAPTEDEG